MKHNVPFIVSVLLVVFSLTARGQGGLIISEVADPGDEYTGRFIELYNAGIDPVDFDAQTYYLSRQSNGGSTWGEVQLTGSVAPGATYVAGGSAFSSFYGFVPDLETGILTGNGDDAYVLFRDGDHTTGTLVDILGVVDVDGTGEPWEYLDSRAVRLEGVIDPSPVWTAAEWEILPADVADCDPGTHQVSPGDEPSPGSTDFSLSVVGDTVDYGQVAEVAVEAGALTSEDGIIAYQFDLAYDPTVLEYADGSVAGTLAAGGTLAINDQTAGTLSVSYMHTTPLTGSGSVLTMQFNTLAVDSSVIGLSSAYLNDQPVDSPGEGRVVIRETAPPTGSILYDDSVNRPGDTLLLTARFSEPMDPAFPVHLDFSGAVTLADLVMTRVSDTVYRFAYPVPMSGGEVVVSFSGGTDLFGNEVVPLPVSGDRFTILPIVPGDVDDDGQVLAYDAALVLQHSVGLDPLPGVDPVPWEPWRDSTANVDGEGGITAFDAGLILQHSAGLITDFTGGGKKSLQMADVHIAVEGQHLVFYSRGDLIGLNVNAEDKNHRLGSPVFPGDRFLTAVNREGAGYRVGWCTAMSPGENTPIMRIPFTGSGWMTFHLGVNNRLRNVMVNLSTGITRESPASWQVYPNPASDRLLFRGPSVPATAIIFNAEGKEMLSAELEGGNRAVDVSDLETGIYVVKIRGDGKQITRRIFIY